MQISNLPTVDYLNEDLKNLARFDERKCLSILYVNMDKRARMVCTLKANLTGDYQYLARSDIKEELKLQTEWITLAKNVFKEIVHVGVMTLNFRLNNTVEQNIQQRLMCLIHTMRAIDAISSMVGSKNIVHVKELKDVKKYGLILTIRYWMLLPDSIITYVNLKCKETENHSLMIASMAAVGHAPQKKKIDSKSSINLWTKIENFSEKFLGGTSKNCVVCKNVEHTVQSNFAVFDCCDHIACVHCIDIRSRDENWKCPACNLRVGAWTTIQLVKFVRVEKDQFLTRPRSYADLEISKTKSVESGSERGKEGEGSNEKCGDPINDGRPEPARKIRTSLPLTFGVAVPKGPPSSGTRNKRMRVRSPVPWRTINNVQQRVQKSFPQCCFEGLVVGMALGLIALAGMRYVSLKS